jgi:ribose transport system permease protein
VNDRTTTPATDEPVVADTDPEDARRRGSWLTSELLEAIALPLAWVALIIVFGFLRPETFLSGANLSSILASQAVLVVVALGLIIPLTAGDYDLSVASVVLLSAMLIAILNATMGVPILLAIAVALAAGLTVGVINGALVVLIGIDSLIVTLGMGTFVTGFVQLISGSDTVAGIGRELVVMVIVNRFLGIPLGFYYAMIVAFLVWYVFTYTPVGRRLLVVGRGRDVARLSGIRVGRVRWGSLVASAGVAAFAGVLYAGTSGAASPTSGLELLLPAFAAAFLGATAIDPGRFNAWGTVVAVYFLVTGITGLQLLGAESYIQNLFYGAALIFAVTLSQFVRRRRAASGV